MTFTGLAVETSIDASIETWTYFEDDWHSGNVPIMGPRTHAAWLGSSVFDGARYFDGAAPDLDLHCARVNASARSFLLQPVVSVERWIALAWEGIGKFAPDAALYVRPMYWPEHGAAGGGVRFDPASTRWCLCVYKAPMPEPSGFAITLSPFRRPTLECAPVEAKAGCLYPNGARALIEAYRRGFGNCVMNDMQGNVAELANSNIFMAKDGAVHTPVPNGTFLDGVTRKRVIAPAGRRRGDGAPADAALRRSRGGRRDLRDGQFRQSGADHADRRARAADGPLLPAGALALLGLRAGQVRAIEPVIAADQPSVAPSRGRVALRAARALSPIG